MSDQVVIYANRNFLGAYQEVEAGKYDIFGNDKLSSLKVPAGMKVTVYEATGCQGKSKTFTSDVSWVGDDFKNETSSIKVERIAPVPGQELGLLVQVPAQPGVQQYISPTARNGLSTSGSTIELGQNPLLHTTDIPSAGFNFTFSGDGKFGVGNNSPRQKLHITAAGD